MLSFSLFRRSKAGLARAIAGLTVMAALLPCVQAQGQAAGNGQAGSAAHRGRILLVLPFDNETGQASLEWIREAAPSLLNSRLASAGFAPMSRADRRYALDHLGLPEDFQPSRATALKLAQTLDADSILVGSYKTEGTDLVAEAQVVDVPHLRMSKPITARGALSGMIAVFDSLAWEVTRQLDPSFTGSEETFVAAGKSLRLDAFEQYIRGITEQDNAERLQHLKKAVQLSPGLSMAWMALGREHYSEQQYEEAAAAFARVDRNSSDALEAGFYRGLSLLFSGQYPKAEEAFAGVARVLPLGEVLNNEGVALSRQGKDGMALYRKAVAADPHAADYHFNLAVTLKRKGNTAEAEQELSQCLKLRPNDSEAQGLLAAWRTPKAATDADAQSDPLERIVRTFDAVAFRQAATMMDQMETARLAALSPQERAGKLAGQAKEYLDRGLLLEAERMYQSAVAADSSEAAAHAGLAEVRERTGDATGARKEAQAAVALAPSAEAYLVLCRLDLAANHLEDAGRNADEALKVNPGSRAAQELKQQIERKASKTQ